MFIICFEGVFFWEVKRGISTINYVFFFCIHYYNIKSRRKLVFDFYGYYHCVYNFFWLLLNYLLSIYQLNCLQFSQLIVYTLWILFLSFYFYFWFEFCCFSKRFTHSLTPWYNILLICNLSSWLVWVSLKCRNSSVW